MNKTLTADAIATKVARHMARNAARIMVRARVANEMRLPISHRLVLAETAAQMRNGAVA